ncbi:MAG: hypothetical protein KDC49_14970 [Saprospiraceae bacterium]|nr:hypothetical protein [Saprospiraceae bacterium]
MAVFTIIILVLLSLLLWVILAPILLSIDTKRHMYQLSLFRVVSVDFRRMDTDLFVHMHNMLFSKTFKIDLLEQITQRSTKKIQPQVKSKKNRFSLSGRKMWRLFRTFKVRNLKLRIDTGDYYCNGLLYPIRFLINGRNRDVQFVFGGDNELELVVENRMIRILRAII